MLAGSLAGFQPSTINQTNFLDSRRAMPWQEHAQHASSQAEAVHVVAGNSAGMVHVWKGTGNGQDTWQPMAVHQQVGIQLQHAIPASCYLQLHQLPPTLSY